MSVSTFSRVCWLGPKAELAAVRMEGPSLKMVRVIEHGLMCVISIPTETNIQHNTQIMTISWNPGFAQVVRHPWFDGFDWDNLHNIEGPLLPTGAKDFPRVIEYLKTCPKTDPNFKQLVAFATQNFDTFEDHGSALDSGGEFAHYADVVFLQ